MQLAADVPDSFVNRGVGIQSVVLRWRDVI